jgi:hypothetical protein
VERRRMSQAQSSERGTDAVKGEITTSRESQRFKSLQEEWRMGSNYDEFDTVIPEPEVRAFHNKFVFDAFAQACGYRAKRSNR